MMKLMYYSPCQVTKETFVFILSCAIISMKMNFGFAESMGMKVMMDKAYCRVCPFTYVTCFVNKIVYLLRDCFSHDAKDSTFVRRFEINWPWVHGVTAQSQMNNE